MKRKAKIRLLALTILMVWEIAPRAVAQLSPQAQSSVTNLTQNSPTTPAAEESPKLLTNYVESGANYLQLDNNYGSWAGGYARSVYERGSDVWNGEINGQREFGDRGVYFAAGDTHTFSENW